MAKFNIIHSSCSTKRFQAQNDGNDWLINENNEPTNIIGEEVFVKLGLDIPTPDQIPDFKTSRPVDWIKIAREEPIKNALADGGEASLLIPNDIKAEVRSGT